MMFPQVAELYQVGWSLARIGEKFGTTAKTVRARLLEIDVDTTRDEVTLYAVLQINETGRVE